MKEYKLTINGNKYNVVVKDIEDTTAEVEVNGTPYEVILDKPVKKSAFINPPRPAVVTADVPSPAAQSAASANREGHAINSPLPGVVLSLRCNVGDTVKSGQVLLVLEAMKMENMIEADRDGKILQIKVSKGDSVLEGAPLVILG